MKWNAQTNRDIVKGIVALLFALAKLADRASLASHPVRCHVLGILRPAEAVVQAFVIGMARDLGAPIPPTQCAWDSACGFWPRRWQVSRRGRSAQLATILVALS